MLDERAAVPPERTDSEPAAVLFVDDDEAMRGVVRDVLESDGFRVLLAADGFQALELVVSSAPDVVVSDLRMPDGGIEFIARLRAAAPATPIILITSFGDAAVQAQARALGISAYFNKPVRMAELKRAIHGLLLAGDLELPSVSPSAPAIHRSS